MDSEKSKVTERKIFNGFLTINNLRDVVILLVLFITTWKLVSAQFTIDLSGFKFSDFLSLTMAIFAISLSVAFFFKATDTSNKFYDNVYKFTKEVSEILGRIEAGFGERLRHIDEGYSGLRDKFENLPFDLPSAKKKEEKEKKEVEEKEAELKRLISNLMERAKLAEHEKTSLLSKLEAAQEEIEKSKRELHVLQRDISEAEADINFIHPEFISELSHYLEGIISPRYMNAPSEVLKDVFESMNIKEMLPSHIIDQMNRSGFLRRNRLTRLGVSVISKALKMIVDKK